MPTSSPTNNHTQKTTGKLSQQDIWETESHNAPFPQPHFSSSTRRIPFPTDQNTHLTSYADDLTVMSHHPKYNTAENNLQQNIYLLEICLTTKRLKVSTKKSSHTLLSLYKQEITLHRHIKHQRQTQTKGPTSTNTHQLRTLEETHDNSQKTAHQSHPDLCIHSLAVAP